MPAHLWKRANGMFYVVDGSTMFTTKTRSERLAGYRLGQYLNRQYSPDRIPRLRLSEVAAEYLIWCGKFNKRTTLADKKRILTCLVTETKDSLISNVSSKAIFDCLSGRKLSAARWNNDRIFIGHMFMFLNRHYEPTKSRIPNPVTDVIRQSVVRSKLRHSLSTNEEKTLLEWLRMNDKELYHYAILDGHTGLRVGELANLRWSDVEFEAKRIRVSSKADWSPKGNRERWVPMDARSLRVLRLLKAKSISHYVCCRRDGLKYARGLDLRMVRAFRDAGVSVKGEKQGGFHILRHTFANRYLEAQGNVRDLQYILGHSSLATTERYLHHNEELIKKTAERVRFGGVKLTRQNPDSKKLRSQKEV